MRVPHCEKMGLKMGSWSPEEDQKLIAFVKRYGIWNWNQMPKCAGLSRSGKSCRRRWVNYIGPDIKRGSFSKEEEEIILKLHELLGNRWSTIAARLPGRTDNEIKNYWHTHLKKCLKDDLAQKGTKSEVQENESNNEANQKKSNETNVLLPNTMEASKLKGSWDIPAVSPRISIGDFSSSSTTDPIVAINEIEKASNSETNQKKFSDDTNTLFPIILEYSSVLKGSRNISVSSQLSPCNFYPSSTDPTIASSEIEKASNSEANSNQKKLSETNLLHPIVMEASKLKGSRDIPTVSPQLSTGDFYSLSATDLTLEINQIDTMGQNIGELQSLWAKPFSVENLYEVEDHSTLADDDPGYTTSTSQMRMQQQMCPTGSLKTNEELQSLSVEPFSGEKNYMVEDYQAAFADPGYTSPTSQMWIQQQMSPFGSLKTYEQLQSLSTEPFSGENLYKVDDHQVAFADPAGYKSSSSEMWIQQQMSPFGSSKGHERIQSLSAEPFSGENFYMVDDHHAAFADPAVYDPAVYDSSSCQMWTQQQMSPFGSLKINEELQILSAEPFSGENVYMVEDHQAAFVDPRYTSPTSKMWNQQQMSPFGSLKTYEQLQSLSAEPFSGENFYMVEDHQVVFSDPECTSPTSQMWIQQQMSPFGSLQTYEELQKLSGEPFSREMMQVINWHPNKCVLCGSSVSNNL